MKLRAILLVLTLGPLTAQADVLIEPPDAATPGLSTEPPPEGGGLASDVAADGGGWSVADLVLPVVTTGKDVEAPPDQLYYKPPKDDGGCAAGARPATEAEAGWLLGVVGLALVAWRRFASHAP